MLKFANVGPVQIFDGLRSISARCVSDIRGGYRWMSRTLRTQSPGLFLKQLLVAPQSIGAVWPSSGYLGRCMAARVPPEGDGLVVELGAGTGVVTQALLNHGVAPSRLCVVERSADFVHFLRQRFPALLVIQGDAATLADYLPADVRVDAIVSSLPLRSLASEDVQRIEQQWCQLLKPGAVLVQFTYARRGPQGADFPGFDFQGDEWVLANLPPARVMAFNRAPV